MEAITACNRNVTFEEKKTRKAEMTEQIFDEQQELGKSIQSLYNNYKKDGGGKENNKISGRKASET